MPACVPVQAVQLQQPPADDAQETQARSLIRFLASSVEACSDVVKVADCVVLGIAGGEVMRKWLRRVSGEHASLSGSLPLAWTSSIFLAADSSRLDLLRSALL